MSHSIGPNPPVHPGEVLRLEFLEPTGLTPYALAKACRVARTRIERLARGDASVTADTALRLSRYFGNSPQFWMNLQANYDLGVAMNETELSLIAPRDAA